MTMKKGISRFMAALVLTAWLAVVPGIAQEHPEHPKGSSHVEITAGDLGRAIKGYVAKDAALKGGYFMVYDVEGRKSLQLTLAKVHDDRLSKIKDGIYFACADFKTPQGKVYDLDIFMEGTDPGQLVTTSVTVHKESGKERYSWVEESGIWKKAKL
jgi:hypothetical protein